MAAHIGLIAGYRPGVIDEVLSFVTNLALVIPGLPLMIILAAYVPRGVPVIGPSSAWSTSPGWGDRC